MKLKLISIAMIALFHFAQSAYSASLKELNAETAAFKLPTLNYALDALKDVIDAETMNIHLNKHHQAYVDNLNKALGSEKVDLETLVRTAGARSAAIRNNAGGHWNHSFFWTVLTPNVKEQKMPSSLEREIKKEFGSMEKFKEAFEKAGAAQFGSGWAWLIRNQNNKLEITGTPNQDNPLMDVAAVKGWPILGADVWEHAYYLKYQNKRAEYLKNFWKVVNWKQVAEYNEEAKAILKASTK